MDTGRMRRGQQVARFALAGAAIGLLVGIYEAVLLYFNRWPSTLVEPDVGYVIWFLAPLIDITFMALVGAFFGLVASLSRTAKPTKQAILAAALLGVAGAHVAWSLDLVHVYVGDLTATDDLTVPALGFAVVFGIAVIVAKAAWRRIAYVFGPRALWPLRPLAKSLLGMTALLLLGLGFHLARRMDLPGPVRATSENLQGPPNIVLISLDTVRADHLSAYGYPRPTTPNIDRITLRGVLFENAIAPSSWTLTSHASILTGLLPHQHAGNVYAPLDAAPQTLAEILKSRGYETAAFNSNNAYGQGGWGLAQGFDVYEDSRSMVRHNLLRILVGRTLLRPLRHRLVRHGLNSYRLDASELNHEIFRWHKRRSRRPFFLFVNYFDTHGPYYAPPPYDRRFGELTDAVVSRVHFGKGFPLRPPLSAEEQAALIAGYDNCLAFLDEQVGELLRFLAQSPDGPNTMVIVTSDHGEAFGEHRTYLHGRNLYYQEVLRVPLIIVGPGIPAGVRINHPVRLRELFSTVLDLALGEELPLRRTSLCRFWTPGFRPAPSDDWVVSELIPFLPDFRPVMVSLLTPEWHLIRDSRGGTQLYHWPSDPGEKVDLSQVPDQQQRIRALEAHLVEVARRSIRPWRKPEYLFALDRPNYSFLRQLAFGPPVESNTPYRESQIGAVQAYFAPPQGDGPTRPQPADLQGLRSIPYQ